MLYIHFSYDFKSQSLQTQFPFSNLNLLFYPFKARASNKWSRKLDKKLCMTTLHLPERHTIISIEVWDINKGKFTTPLIDVFIIVSFILVLSLVMGWSKNSENLRQGSLSFHISIYRYACLYLIIYLHGIRFENDGIECESLWKRFFYSLSDMTKKV